MEPVFIAGPCVIETMDVLEEIAQELVQLKSAYNQNVYYESIYRRR